jgi:hypothetical protein
MMRVHIVFAANKLAKFTRQPGKEQFEALIHLLRYLCDNNNYGTCFYSDIKESPMYQMLLQQNISEKHSFFGFADASWNDDQDNGRSTGCFIITYMGGAIDHSSNMPDPVALLSAKAEYNEGCINFMAARHLRMLLCKLEGSTEDTKDATSIYLDSKSAVAMGDNYKDTKHTRHILRHYHYVRQNIEANRFIARWISTEFPITDIGTKNNDGPRPKILLQLVLIQIQDQMKDLVQEILV